MTPGASLLLGLVWFVDQRIQAQAGASLRPSIWAAPGTLIAVQGSVTIFCRIPPGVTACRVYHVEDRVSRPERDPQGPPGVAQFSLQNVAPFHAGTYYCQYWTEGDSSGRSDPLELVVTGAYVDKPSLTAQPGAQVASGGQVTLLCHSSTSYDVFTLCRDGAASLHEDCPQQNHSSFLISPVGQAHGGTYRCYGFVSHSPLLWSLPSDPLELLVTGPPSPLVVGVLAAAVLLCLLFLFLLLHLCQGRRNRQRARHRDPGGGTKSPVRDTSSAVDVQGGDEYDTQPREDGQMDTQGPASEDPPEVAYAQLHPGTLSRRLEPLPSRARQDATTQPCVYATLTLS